MDAAQLRASAIGIIDGGVATAGLDMKKAFSLLFTLLVIAGIALLVFPPRERMQQAVQDFGFQDVHLTGFAFLGCAEQDTFRQKWAGRNTAGKPVTGVICGGLAKGWTVRLT